MTTFAYDQERIKRRSKFLNDRLDKIHRINNAKTEKDVEEGIKSFRQLIQTFAQQASTGSYDKQLADKQSFELERARLQRDFSAAADANKDELKKQLVKNNQYLKDLLKDFNKSLKDRDAARGRVDAPYSPSPDQHSMVGKAMHLVNFKPDGIAFEMIYTLIIYQFQILFAIEFAHQKQIYNQAKQWELTLDGNGNPMHSGRFFTWSPNQKGPDLYPLGLDGKPDYTQWPVEQNKETRDLARANGYIVEPNFFESYKILWSHYVNDMYGQGLLNDTQRRYINVLSQQAQKGASHDLQEDSAMIAGMNMANKPRPSTTGAH